MLCCSCFTCVQCSAKEGWLDGGRALHGGDLGREWVNAELHFSPETSNSWLNRELLLKQIGAGLFCRSG